MLVVTRKTGEKFLIGGNIEITVLRVGRGYVRLGIEAPRDIEILREELRSSQFGAESGAEPNPDPAQKK